MSGAWQVAGGSVRGTRHRRTEANNQDGLFFTAGEPLVLVVTDGCSAARASELGALLGARLVARRAAGAAAWPGLADPDAYARAVRDGLLADLAWVHAALGGTPADLLDHLLFTAVVAVADAGHALVLVMGDGVAAVNGRVRVVESAENRPAYPAYGLLDPGGAPAPLVLWHGAAAAVRTLMVGTDGAADFLALLSGDGGLDPLFDDPTFANPDQLRRRLALANRERQRVDWDARITHRDTGALPDDTTLILARRRTPHAARP